MHQGFVQSCVEMAQKLQLTSEKENPVFQKLKAEKKKKNNNPGSRPMSKFLTCGFLLEHIFCCPTLIRIKYVNKANKPFSWDESI